MLTSRRGFALLRGAAQPRQYLLLSPTPAGSAGRPRLEGRAHLENEDGDQRDGARDRLEPRQDALPWSDTTAHPSTTTLTAAAHAAALARGSHGNHRSANPGPAR